MSATGFQVLRSSDPGAPTLNGTAGSLLGVLRALLDIGGSDAYWSEVYTGTNKAVFRADAGERYYLRVDDSAAQYAQVRGYGSMSDVDTGSSPFPTTAQFTNWTWHKSSTADSTARTYFGVSTDRFFYLLVRRGSGSAHLCVFGETKRTSGLSDSTIIFAQRDTSYQSDFSQHCQTGNPFDLSSSYTPPTGGTASFLPSAKDTDGTGSAGACLSFRPNVSTSIRLGTYPAITLVPSYWGSSHSGGSIGRPRGSIPFVYHTLNEQTDPGIAVGDTFTDANGATYQIEAVNGISAASSSYNYLALMVTNDETGVP